MGVSSERDRIILDESNDRPAAKVGMVVVALTAVLAAWGFLGLVGSPVEVPAQDLPNVTSPTQQPLALMPDMEGLDLFAVRNSLRDLGLDLEIVSQVHWIANPDVPNGRLISQSPPPGTELFDPNELSLVMSAGGPVVTWDDVPPDLQILASTDVAMDPTEPVLKMEMPGGTVYKTDDLLFGGCLAVDQARDTFYDGSFRRLCHVGEPQQVVAWLADGAMLAVDGLPFPSAQQLTGTDIVWTEEQRLAGPQYWQSTQRQEPRVLVDGEVIWVLGGYHQFSLTPQHGATHAEEIAALIEPLDIRGSLVVQLTPPLEFAGNWDTNDERGSTLARFQWFDAVSTVDGIDLAWHPLIENKALAAMTLGATTWSVIQNETWQYAVPSGWIGGESVVADPAQPLTAATFVDTNPGEWCDAYPIGSLASVGPSDAFVGVFHRTGTGTGTESWPNLFTPTNLETSPAEDPASGCLAGIDAEVRVSNRVHSGEPLDIIIAFGADVDPEVRKQAFAILDSFEPLPNYNLP